MSVDESELERYLSAELGAEVTLRHLERMPEKSVFHLTRSGGEDLFVKCAPIDDVRRSWSILSVAELPFLPRAEFMREWNGVGVIGLAWMQGDRHRVLPEEMNPAQAQSLLRAHGLILKELKAKVAGRGVKPLPDADGLYNTVAGFAARHPLFAPLLRPLTSIPRDERTYDPATVTTIVNDFHCENYAFLGDEVAAVYDFDWMRLGSPCEDITYSFIRRLRKARMGASQRRRVAERFLEIVRASPYPALEWRRAVNICRLEAAAKRLRSHPDLGLIALDVHRRDRQLDKLAKSI